MRRRRIYRLDYDQANAWRNNALQHEVRKRQSLALASHYRRLGDSDSAEIHLREAEWHGDEAQRWREMIVRHGGRAA